MSVLQFTNMESHERYSMIRVVDSLANCPQLAKDIFRRMALEYDIGQVCINYRFILSKEKDVTYYGSISDKELLEG